MESELHLQYLRYVFIAPCRLFSASTWHRSLTQTKKLSPKGEGVLCLDLLFRHWTRHIDEVD
jgi:hypothetical protein